ncbi:MAG: carbamoyl-phosphate synthase large subunit [Deltaproteobacteria bacterium]|nr:carbamoyl-phosphate synthase large subunit [Deltaproteobacteria bacterium]
MPKREDLSSILIIGAGPIVIGQACEFDYSGTQACKALRREGYRVILVNSNPATIMTDPDLADAIYVEPINWRSVAAIIAREKPDAILPTMGGQTALNTALDLDKHGVLAEHGVELIGASVEAIEKAESRELFKAAMEKIGLEMPRSAFAYTLEEALEAVKDVGYPAIIRPSFTLGGTGGGVAHDEEELREIVARGLDASPTSEVLVEESVLGWKEYEMEVVRDRRDNCIIVCAIENLDPMGVHTGDSITVAPAQTLTDKEYQRMRDASFAVLREIGVDTGGSNVQFGLDPATGRMVIIEMNPRVSRSSALASKATGFPIASVAARLAVGYTLDELANDITRVTPASFEPAIDYVVTKIPRFTFEKFPGAKPRLTTQMKSVGEVMAIGRTFLESLQKAYRGMEIGASGLDEKLPQPYDDALIQFELSHPGPDRLFYVAEAFRAGMSLERVHGLTGIDPWFLDQVLLLVETEAETRKKRLADLGAAEVRRLKRMGFSDKRIGRLVGAREEVVRAHRHAVGVRPVYKRVDTCAAEFASETPYLYSTYEAECEARPTGRDKVMILGAGPNRIGQGIEFDYCCCHAAMALREDGVETIMVNCNPETVSTDYDTSDRLYFEPVSLEDVLEIVHLEKPRGVIVQLGGQTPLKLARGLEAAGVPILGTTPAAIDAAEDREQFQALLRRLGLRQPENETALTFEEARLKAVRVGFPLVVRPSFVLGGRAMEIVRSPEELEQFLGAAFAASENQPVLLDRYLRGAVEVDVDAVSDGEHVVIGGVMEHIEQAGVHSGDSACCLPPHNLSAAVQAELRRQTIAMAKALGVCGLMNVQFAVQGEDIYVLEVNPRASRTAPFVSKATGRPLAKVAARAMAGTSLAAQGVTEEVLPRCFSVKEAVFPFRKFPGVDVMLGPEMKSTGEAMGSGATFGEAYAKAQLAASVTLPLEGRLVVRVDPEEAEALLPVARRLQAMGFHIAGGDITADALALLGLPLERVTPEDRLEGTVMVLASGRGAVHFRKAAVAAKITCYTTVAGLDAAATAIETMREGDMPPRSLAEVQGA